MLTLGGLPAPEHPARPGRTLGGLPAPAGRHGLA